ncbi:cytochrome c biogenesis protein CcdA [Amycolatopsis sp. PS_44_ISF1]|uniref:cytochrome c biogenesis protein CcdA n=1 Tax=Amycolatopsis sp. PS_44_ISF1 TaxID=2974917 RepID=UPI0028E0529D|nr:cytochrome c biogenesis protein CcdA [Amycolatopsis sp. PS_44_ISF1]MDT8913844.1 sulfite exporter TauE/SafE family protein [Amycolatopsis sp. PS_44_ISF1]
MGGLITGISPCVLPVLPVLFMTGGAGVEPGRRRPFLIVAGLALSFALVTLLGTLVLAALGLPGDVLRWAGLAVLVVLGVAMMFPRVQDRLERPFARLGRKSVPGRRGAFVLGIALGTVYVPCAGPVLAAITVAGATRKIGADTVALTVAFAVGTAIPLLLFALAGHRVAERVKAFRDRQRQVRFFAGLVVIGLAVALTFNVTDVLQRAVPDYTASLGQALGADRIGGGRLQQCPPSDYLQECGPAPQPAGISRWLNTEDGKPPARQGKVVLYDFWAYSCINCQRAIPHVEAWYRRYHDAGLEIVGVHTPEYAFERVPANVADGVRRQHITYPVAIDDDYATWNAFGNQSWPAEYLSDATGQVRHVSVGEGDYDGTESLIRDLLAAADPSQTLPPRTDTPDRTPANPSQTQEIYLGSSRGGSEDVKRQGQWSSTEEYLAAGRGASLTLDYDAATVYLDVGGTGTVTATTGGVTRSIPVSGPPDIHPVVQTPTPARGTVTLTLSPGLQAYSFTFG